MPEPPAFLHGDHKGFAVLLELLEMANAGPELSTAQLIERWRDRPEGARLAELAAEESLVRDGRAAAARSGHGAQAPGRGIRPRQAT